MVAGGERRERDREREMVAGGERRGTDCESVTCARTLCGLGQRDRE